ncbi:MAG TPA: sarcosine oxidase subunit delta [Steroidobacteraceae bacterium]|jgi:sarcosine oxidase subunit delta
MLLINCPYCGERPELEFVYGGEAHIARPAAQDQVSLEQWAQFLYARTNTRGVHAERWRHTHGCGRFFNALRDTTTDQFIAIYEVGAAPPPFARAHEPP